MKARCTNPLNESYAYYGAKGVTVCASWSDSFEKFVEDMGDRPAKTSIERKDGSKGYSPENCYWANAHQQNRNRSNNVKVVLDGVERLLIDVCSDVGVSYATARYAMKKYGSESTTFKAAIRQAA